VLRSSQASTQRSDSKVTVRLIPLPSEDSPAGIGPHWNDLFKIHIMAEYPATWSETDKHLDLAEEMKQVIRDNWSFLEGGEQAALKSRSWGYGFSATGEQTLNTVNIVVTYEAPGLSATA
jgi:hypothetical protein